MGSDKALLRLSSGETLLEHALALVASVTPEVRLLAPRNRYASLSWAGPIIEDIYPDRGPLAGIHAALASTSTELNLIFAVDMPRMTAPCLRYLMTRAQQNSALVTVPDIAGREQPLCAVYRRAFCDVAEQALKAGNNKVARAFPPDQTQVISSTDLVAAGFPAGLFENLNTGDEWQEFTQNTRPKI